MSRYLNLKYLKHCGELIGVKVTIRIVDGYPMIYIRDLEFTDYNRALQYLRHIAESECVLYTLE
jgi:hypothetical protein